MTSNIRQFDTASFLFKINSYSFHYGLRALNEAYIAAREAPERTRKSIVGDLERFERELEAESVPAGQTADEDNAYDHAEHLSEMMYDVDETIRYIREAFIVSLAHFWERRLPKLIRKAKFDFNDACDFLRKQGGDPNAAKLDALRLTANVLKHSGGRSADELFKAYPSMFNTSEMAKNHSPPSYEYLLIDDGLVAEFFQEVKRSVGR